MVGGIKNDDGMALTLNITVLVTKYCVLDCYIILVIKICTLIYLFE